MARIFRKQNATVYPDALICEAEGLECLAEELQKSGSMVRVPRIQHVDEAVLEIEEIQSGPATSVALAQFGEGLARLHKRRQPQYGWGRDNYIGLSPQKNGWSQSWGQFFVRNRLEYQVSRIRDRDIRDRIEGVLGCRGDMLAEWLSARCEHPSLLHGDLWSGNVLFEGDAPWMIDPAVYCGDREADLAMTEIFGGFGPSFYEAYDQIYPRSPDYAQKRGIYNLYHYLNHFNLFGSGYLGGCERGLEQIAAIR